VNEQMAMRCDVLVIGAGPAGSACAQALAEAGLEVLLADQHAFPRDKVCGDGLIPDAHAALKRLGLYDAVMAEAAVPNLATCVGPRGGRIEIPGPMAVLPRKRLDHLLVQSAQRAGARLLPPARFMAPLREGERVVGARLRGMARGEGAASGQHEAAGFEVQCRWLVLATGATPQAMLAAGLCERQQPSGMALRGYVLHPQMADRIRSLEFVWHPRLRGGYGWIFPAPGGRFNLGVGVVDSHSARGGKAGRAGMVDVNLRRMLDVFGEVYAPAAQLLAGGQLQGELKGAPLRCTLQGARYTAPGLLATGEAIGSTYSFTGEGIGKALETGLLAADALIQGQRAGLDEATVRASYEASLVALKPRFELYTKANRVSFHPWLADVVIWRAQRSARVRRKLQSVLDESVNPGRLFTLRGLVKMFAPGG
jgi:flavin-dependent dehydrogenase